MDKQWIKHDRNQSFDQGIIILNLRDMYFALRQCLQYTNQAQKTQYGHHLSSPEMCQKRESSSVCTCQMHSIKYLGAYPMYNAGRM